MEKTEEPTPRRLRRALERGDSPISPLAVRAAALGTFVSLAPPAIRAIAARFDASLARALRAPEAVSPADVVTDVLWLVTPALGCAAIAALVAGIVQTSGMVAFGSLAPRLDRLAPDRIARLFDGLRARRGLLAATGAAFAAAVTSRIVRAGAPGIATAIGRPARALDVAGTLASRAAWTSLVVLGAVALADLVLSRSSFFGRHRMSRREVLEEQRETSGAPEARRARRQIHERAIGR